MSAVKYMTYMTERIGPLPFCPGCGHQLLIKALDKALVLLQYDPNDVVIVTDIGCIGLSDRYFVTNAFHGLHGRAITYACGLKLAQPKLKVITIMGDGGCGIGGTHLLNVARRNIGISLIVGNNFNYGMTGGQHSVTTPTGGLTSTTPWGNIEGPMDLCGTTVAAGGAWIYRATAFDKDLPQILAQAIEQKGFSFIDVWELCTAYYSPRNKIKKKDLFQLLENYGFKLGLLVDKPRPEYSDHYWQAYEAGKSVIKKSPPIEKKFEHAVEKQTGIVIAGSAGQKIKSTATLFAQAAMFSGLETTQKDDYPITVMTGHSLAEIIVSPERIDYTAIDSPDFFIVISEDGLKRSRHRIEQLAETCVLFADETLELPKTAAQVVKLPLIEISRKIGRLSIGIIALAAALKHTALFPVQAFEKAITTFQKASIAKINIKAIQTGIEMIPGE
ncbi:thiamine pyrophosphate-dependent enzyme [candidate division CSSED10-310 bacterium]|uniref:Thiamine pyrophosphate-dependent enzyme n=1 Tax=candidate division CSSED10-310 bacterium TaxID=2855610 RepID=A0ABV6Z314_UNCC1